MGICNYCENLYGYNKCINCTNDNEEKCNNCTKDILEKCNDVHLDTEELKMCPFCGSKAVLIFDKDSWTIECDNEACGCHMYWFDTKMEAIDIWNRRNQ